MGPAMGGVGPAVWEGPCWAGTAGWRGRGGPAQCAGAWALTHVAEDHWQEDQAVQQAQHGDEEVEAEEEDLDELRLGQAQNKDTGQVGHGHASEHLGVTGRREAGHGKEG